MALNALSNVAEGVLGHGKSEVITQDVSNPAQEGGKYGDPTDTMLALAWMGPNKVEMIEVPKPAIVDPGDVVVKVTGTTICGSDRHLLHNHIIQLKKGDILGHEWMGVVDKVGPDVKRIKKGDRVVASFQIACGSCEQCNQRLSSVCQNTNRNSLERELYGSQTAGMFGYSHLTGGNAGGQAEYVRCPIGDVNLLKIPDSVPDEKALFLSDVIVTAYHCVVDTGVQKGDTVAVWGLGAVGLFAAKWAFLKGAKRVIGVDSNWRLDYAKSKIPELELLDFSKVSAKDGVSKAILGMVPGGLDVALECASGEFAKSYLNQIKNFLGVQNDTSEIVNEMILAVKPFGRCGITGIYAGFTSGFNIGSVMEKGVRFIGNGQAPVHKYWEEILNDYIIPGKIDPLMVLTHRIDIKDTAKAYYEFDKQGMGMEKIFIQTRFSAPPCPGAPAVTTLA